MKANKLYALCLITFVLLVLSCKKENPVISTVNSNVLNNGKWETYPEDYIGMSGSIYSFGIDGLGNKWFTTASNLSGNNANGSCGVYKLEGTNWTNYTFSGNALLSLFIDQQNNIWLSKNDTGTWSLMKLVGTNWISYNTPPTYPSTKFVTDLKGNLWFGAINSTVSGNNTGSGVYKFDGNQWSIYFPDTFITAIAVDNQNNIWVGGETTKNDSTGITVNNFISEFNGTNWINYNWATNNLTFSVFDDINSIHIDNSGNKWFGTNGGIIKFDNTNWTVYNPLLNVEDESIKPPIGYGQITSFVTDHTGNIWIGTGNCGLYEFNGTSWLNYTSDNSRMFGNHINSIAIDASGNLWISGSIEWPPVSLQTVCEVSKFDGTNWTNYTPSNSGLISNNVYNIETDPQGNIWFLTSNGVSELLASE